MGNEPSKPRGNNTPSFSRTDTSTSVKSSRSLRSRKSFTDAASLKSNNNTANSATNSPAISRRNSSKSTTTVSEVNDNLRNMSLNERIRNDYNIGDDDQYDDAIIDEDYPQMNEYALPPSMVRMAPKTPILRVNSSSDVSNPNPSTSSNNLSSSYNSTHNLPMKTESPVNNIISSPRNTSDISNVNSDKSDSEEEDENDVSYKNNLGIDVPKSHTHSETDVIYQSNNLSPALHESQNIRIPQSSSPPVMGNTLNTPLTPTNSSFKSTSASSQHSASTLTANDGALRSPRDISTFPNRRIELNIEDLIQRLLDAGYSGKRTKSLCLKNSEVAMICSTAREIFLSQPSLLELSAPVKIVGDVHGQFSDLIRIFTKCGFPPAANYLFLGDYVDRGKQSLETILLLLCYKIKYPENFFLLRGNHECAQITRAYGFYDECKRRTNLKTWKIFIDTFNTLPITAIVASKIFCVHGGLSPVLNSMDEIRKIQRPTDVPDFGLLNDLLWSDPADTPNEWEDNERGVSYCFNKVAINKFLNKFQFDLVVRAHMVVEDGYEFFNDRSLVTVFSAPNYCGEFDNWGAVMSVSDELLCSFELLDPLDSIALKQLMKKGKHERRAAVMNSSSVSPGINTSY